jgi:hypothetical protein
MPENMAALGSSASAACTAGPRKIIPRAFRAAERCQHRETLRIKGWLSAPKRTATSYALLICNKGRVRETYDLLAAIYGWFTEGFLTKDPREAKAQLCQLAR